jgi:Arm DNA-binding domain
MAKTTHRLSAIKVANLKFKGLYPDGGGLYLRITETGTKSWIYRFTIDGKARDMGLGTFREVTLSQARDLAIEARRQRKAGIAPSMNETASQPRNGSQRPARSGSGTAQSS